MSVTTEDKIAALYISFFNSAQDKNGFYGDKIDLDISVQNINNKVSGLVNTATFVEDINKLLNIPTNGFDTNTNNDISSSLVDVTSGDLVSKTYLVVDVDADDIFSANDFFVDVTGVILTNFTLELFI